MYIQVCNYMNMILICIKTTPMSSLIYVSFINNGELKIIMITEKIIHFTKFRINNICRIIIIENTV